MNYEDMTLDELEQLLIEENKIIAERSANLGVIAHHRALKAREIELQNKLGNLGDGEMEILRKLLSQSTTPAPIESAEDIKF